MNANDYTDPSLISPGDPASRDYQRRETCRLCRGECVSPCEDCGGQSDADGMILVDGERMHCEQGTCADGVRECPRCDGAGAEV